MSSLHNIPLSLYIHIPWCVKKCPYCDFNSHASEHYPENEYCQKLLQDLETDLPHVYDRSIQTIFFGGGTPSLFHPKSIETILNGVSSRLSLAPNAEVTLEANPGTLEHRDFNDYYTAGINRISLGVQSFDNSKLASLGRIHSQDEIKRAIDRLQSSFIPRYNIDLMYGLPKQTLQEALTDLEQAIAAGSTHISWYHLTLEPNTVFYKHPPLLPDHDLSYAMQMEGLALLQAAGFTQYEISAFAKPGAECLHNRNYWEFGDYLGIGAGAHGKFSHQKNHELTIVRTMKRKLPKSYLEVAPLASERTLMMEEIPLEFMMNALRLNQGFSKALFEHRTGLKFELIEEKIQLAQLRGFLIQSGGQFIPTSQGRLFLNDLTALFLP